MRKWGWPEVTAGPIVTIEGAAPRVARWGLDRGRAIVSGPLIEGHDPGTMAFVVWTTPRPRTWAGRSGGRVTLFGRPFVELDYDFYRDRSLLVAHDSAWCPVWRAAFALSRIWREVIAGWAFALDRRGRIAADGDPITLRRVIAATLKPEAAAVRGVVDVEPVLTARESQEGPGAGMFLVGFEDCPFCQADHGARFAALEEAGELVGEVIAAIRAGDRKLFEGLSACAGIRAEHYDDVWACVRTTLRLP